MSKLHAKMPDRCPICQYLFSGGYLCQFCTNDPGGPLVQPHCHMWCRVCKRLYPMRGGKILHVPPRSIS